MAGHNPVLSRDKAFQPGGYAGFDYDYPEQRRAGQYQQGQQYGQAPQYGGAQQPWAQPPAQPSAQPVPSQPLENMYAAGARAMGRMTYEGVINRTAIVLGVLVVAAAAAWLGPVLVGQVLGANDYEAQGIADGLGLVLMIVGLIGGFVLGLVNSFKKTPSPALIIAYALFEGAVLGALSRVYETAWNGVVPQAVLATLCVFVGVLLLFRSGKVRTSPKLNKIFFAAMIGLLLFSLVNIGLMLFGQVGGTFGLRSGPLGIVIGLVAILLASYSLVMDFEDVQHGVRNGAPANLAWRCAFGLVLTLVWMYLEILRILAIFRE